MQEIPTAFANRMREVYGEAADVWIAGLPALIDELAERWSLTVGPPFGLSYNYVAPATRADGTPVVLKVGIPDKELISEVEALLLYDGGGIARLLELDRERSAFLIERLLPGTPLARLEDDERATSIAAGVMRRLWRPAPTEHHFPTVADWARGLERLRARYDGGTGPLPPRLVEEAEAQFAELLASAPAPMLLHGDLHHDNILMAQRAPWLAIDPKGLVGDPGYELGAFLYNPMPDFPQCPDLARVLARRINQLAEELGMESARIRGWGLAQAVLSAWWSIEDHGYGWEGTIPVAEALAGITA
jgi:streptomycin 6-kinase